MDTVDARVAVLEEIAKSTRDAIVALHADMRDLRREMKEVHAETRADLRDLRADLRDLRAHTDSGFRWLLRPMLGGFAGLLGAMAHDFHWL